MSRLSRITMIISIEKMPPSIEIVNFSIFSIEDFYHPHLFFVYKIFWEVSLIITTVFFVFTLYMILKNSKEIGEYKYFMIHQLVWSYLFDLILGIWQPIPLWPFYIGFGIGWFRFWKGIWAILPFYAIMITSIGMGVSIYMSLFHRYVYITPNSSFARRYESLTFKLLFYGFIFLFFECAIMIPTFLSYVDTEVLRKSITSRYPVMTFFFESEPSMFGYNPDLNDQLTVFYMMCLVALFIGLIIFSISIYFSFIGLMMKNKHSMSVVTHQMQLVLFKTLYVQSLLLIGVLLFPFLLSLFFAFLGIRYALFLVFISLILYSMP